MTDADALAEAEQAWRWRAEHPRGLGLSTRQKVQLRTLLAEYDRLKAEEIILSTKLAVKVDQRQRLMAQNDSLRAQLDAQSEIVEAARALAEHADDDGPIAEWRRKRDQLIGDVIAAAAVKRSEA